jgi:hypothetical protein
MWFTFLVRKTDRLLWMYWFSGITEAFLHAVVTKGELLQSNAWLFVFSIVYMCLSVVLIRAAPSTGLILANSISILIIPKTMFTLNSTCKSTDSMHFKYYYSDRSFFTCLSYPLTIPDMGMRIIYSLTFIRHFFKVSFWCPVHCTSSLEEKLYWMPVSFQKRYLYFLDHFSQISNASSFPCLPQWGFVRYLEPDIVVCVICWQHSQTFSLWQAIPNWRVLGVLLSSAVITYFSKTFVLDYDNFSQTAVKHVGVGVACLGVLVSAVYKYERAFLRELATFRGTHRHVHWHQKSHNWHNYLLPLIFADVGQMRGCFFVLLMQTCCLVITCFAAASQYFITKVIFLVVAIQDILIVAKYIWGNIIFWIGPLEHPSESSLLRE